MEIESSSSGGGGGGGGGGTTDVSASSIGAFMNQAKPDSVHYETANIYPKVARDGSTGKLPDAACCRQMVSDTVLADIQVTRDHVPEPCVTVSNMWFDEKEKRVLAVLRYDREVRDGDIASELSKQRVYDAVSAEWNVHPEVDPRTGVTRRTLTGLTLTTLPLLDGSYLLGWPGHEGELDATAAAAAAAVNGAGNKTMAPPVPQRQTPPGLRTPWRLQATSRLIALRA